MTRTASKPADQKMFPAISYDRAAYRAELADHLHDPFASRMVELLWHGTRDYARFIDRDGVDYQRALLAKVREGREAWRQEVAQRKDLVAQMRQEAAAATPSKARKDIDKARAEAARKLALADDLLRTIPAAEAQRASYADLDARLTAALMFYIEQPRREAAPPVFNITVEPPVVQLEATVEVPPVEIREVAITKLPARKTSTAIERNTAGEITHSEQIESDV